MKIGRTVPALDRYSVLFARRLQRGRRVERTPDRASRSSMLHRLPMTQCKVLFLAADPRPEGMAPLALDEDVRRIKEKILGAPYYNEMEFDFRWAVRTDDLLLALNQTHPHVVHFSGHGGRSGLVLVGEDQQPLVVRGQALVKLFETLPGEIRVVVLNACLSLPQAQEIAKVVGCAIGTQSEIDDKAAILFGAAFYRALAFGKSVKEAFEQARAAVAMEGFNDECTVLVSRSDVDPAKLYLVRPPLRTWGWLGVVAVWLATLWSASALDASILAAFAVSLIPVVVLGGLAHHAFAPPDTRDGFRTLTVQCALLLPLLFGVRNSELIAGRPPVVVSSSSATMAHSVMMGSVSPATPPGPPGTTLSAAMDHYHSGNYKDALPILLRETKRKDPKPQAFTYLGLMYLNGYGVRGTSKDGIRLLRRAAVRGDAEAMFCLGSVSEYGEGSRRNLDTATTWFHKAAEAGSAQALTRIAARGAIDGGSRDAWFQLGLMYRTCGNDTAARMWLRKAAGAGNVAAMNDLAVLYVRGMGGKVYRDEANRLFRQAAAAGSALAQENLRRMEADQANPIRRFFLKLGELL